MTEQGAGGATPTPTPTPAEPERFGAWIDTSAASDAFWDAAPSWPASTAHREVDGVELIWTQAGIVSVAPPAAVVVRFFDGEATLRELAEDLADAADVELAGAEALVATVAAELHALGALDDVAMAEPPPPPTTRHASTGGHDSAEPTVPEVLPDDVVRVEHSTDSHGNKQTIEHLVGGGRRVTSEFTYAFGDGEQAAKDAERLAEQLMDGTRSAAELVPRDSCLGSKLRNDDEVPLLTVRCGDGRLRSVRCHDARVLDLLTELAGARLADPSGRGPIEAFVVTPLEGDGPLRIYDHRGERRGRPRTVDDAVAVVDELLGEAEVRDGHAPDGDVLLNGHIARRGDEALLLARDAVAAYRPRRDLRRQGWSLAAGLAVVVDDECLVVPSGLGEPTRVPFAALRLVGYPQAPTIAAEVPLLVENAATATASAALALDRVIGLGRAVPMSVQLEAVVGTSG